MATGNYTVSGKALRNNSTHNLGSYAHTAGRWYVKTGISTRLNGSWRLTFTRAGAPSPVAPPGGGSGTTFPGADGCTYKLVNHQQVTGEFWIKVAPGASRNLPAPYTGWGSAPSSDRPGHCAGGDQQPPAVNTRLPAFGFGAVYDVTWTSLNANHTYAQNKRNGQSLLFQNFQCNPLNGATVNARPINILKDIKAKYQRINIIRPANARNDAWIGIYADLVADVIKEGFIPYVLVTEGAFASFPGPRNSNGGAVWPNQDNFVQNQYPNLFKKVVDQLAPRGAKIFEMFNEPDNWSVRHNGKLIPDSPKFRTPQIAQLWDRTYRAVKAGGKHSDVLLVSSGLIATDNTGAATYFKNAVNHGKRNFGWGRNGFYPFDGVGYHLYLSERVPHLVQNYSRIVKSAIDSLITSGKQVMGVTQWNKRKIWVSEVGWQDWQVNNRLDIAIEGTMSALKNSQGRQVAMGMWYNLIDSTTGPFGMLRGSTNTLPIASRSEHKIRSSYWKAKRLGQSWFRQ